VGHHLGQECMTKASPLGELLNAAIEDIGKVAGALRIRISGTEHIDTIAKFGIHRRVLILRVRWVVSEK
jgi:hypothetical protein